MSNNCHIQTGSCMLLGVALDAACRIPVGGPVFTTAGVGSVVGETERKEGTDYTAPNFGGATCGPEQRGETTERWLNMSGNFCLKDWSLMSATSGNPTVLDGDGNVVGYAKLTNKTSGHCSTLSKPKVALVVARRAATADGGCVAPQEDTGATGVVGHFFPMTADWLWDIPNFEDARAAVNFAAKGYANPQIGAGPLNLWPADYDPNAVPNEAMHAEVFLDPATLPAVNCDTPIAHPALDVRTDDSF